MPVPFDLSNRDLFLAACRAIRTTGSATTNPFREELERRARKGSSAARGYLEELEVVALERGAVAASPRSRLAPISRGC